MRNLYSILALKCARCRQGDLFRDQNPYHLKRLFDMYEHCPVCGQRYQPEPGFWFGAMYVSYALNVALWITLFVAIYTFISLYWVYFLITGAIVNILMVPLIFRWSRAVWMHFFIPYDPEAASKEKDRMAE